MAVVKVADILQKVGRSCVCLLRDCNRNRTVHKSKGSPPSMSVCFMSGPFRIVSAIPNLGSWTGVAQAGNVDHFSHCLLRDT